MEPGDVIVAFNGKPVKKNDDLVQMVMATRPGTSVPLRVIREGKEKTLSVTVDELDLEAEGNQAQASRGRGDRDNDQSQESSGFGITIQNITPDVARRLRLDDGTRGAVIVDVDPQSPAARAGLSGGDVILRVNGQAVGNAADAQRELSRVQSGRAARLLVLRGGQERFVIVTKE
jgi:serine protease Do